jgi:hypothetical protein
MTGVRELTPLPDPLPGLRRLRRRLADRVALRDDLLARLARTPDPSVPGGILGARLDVAGDPALVTAAELWSRVADGVCAYGELTSGEAYLGTAQDWTDLRRITDLVGYRPAQRTAAHGWLRAEITPGSSPLLPAGTQVQAPGTPLRAAQTYEVAADTQLRADWAGLTVTGVPAPGVPSGSELRFLIDPGYRPADRVVFVAETGVAGPTTWQEWLIWLTAMLSGTGYVPSSGLELRGIARVTKRSNDLGATLLEFDRPLAPLLPGGPGTNYGAYRLRATLALAARLDKLSYVDGSGHAQTADSPPASGEPAVPHGDDWVLVTDASEVSAGQNVMLYAGLSSECQVNTVKAVTPADWHVAPGTVKRVAQLTFDNPISSDLRGSGLTVLLTDGRQIAQHYELPDLAATSTVGRLHPRPAVIPPRLAICTGQAAGGQAGVMTWELTGCTESAINTDDDPGGILVNLTDSRMHSGSRSPATGNVAPIQHGTTRQGPVTLAGGTAVLAGPVTGDVGADGSITDSLTVQVAGVRFDEVASLYGRGPADLVYTTRLAADGQLVLVFGDGVAGALPRGDVQASWRVGGGLAGELDGSQITSLVGTVNGVRKIGGVGPASGAADQEDPLRMRKAAAARIRALDRAVAIGDLADLALTVPGTSHSVAWRGAGPPGCACQSSGLHVAALRTTGTGARAPVAAELVQLGAFLDARRDTTVPLCVCAAVPSPIAVSASIAVDPRRTAATVLGMATAALLDPAGPLAAMPRELGVPLDGSDVIEVVQPVAGVLGITGLTLSGGLSAATSGDLSLGRRPAARYELLFAASANLGLLAHG